MRKTPMVERFWSKVDKAGPTPQHAPQLGPCWQWIASVDTTGYGQISDDSRRLRKANRVAWEFTCGPTRGLHVLHRCDNRRCVRPDHLFLGTDADNAKDRDAKNRGGNRRGTRNGRAVLTDDDVIDIRTIAAMGAQGSDIADAYGLARSQVYRILHREQWAHLP